MKVLLVFYFLAAIVLSAFGIWHFGSVSDYATFVADLPFIAWFLFIVGVPAIFTAIAAFFVAFY